MEPDARVTTFPEPQTRYTTRSTKKLDKPHGTSSSAATSTLPKMFACPHCPRIFVKQRCFETHLVNQHNDNSKPDQHRVRLRSRCDCESKVTDSLVSMSLPPAPKKTKKKEEAAPEQNESSKENKKNAGAVSQLKEAPKKMLSMPTADQGAAKAAAVVAAAEAAVKTVEAAVKTALERAAEETRVDLGPSNSVEKTSARDMMAAPAKRVRLMSSDSSSDSSNSSSDSSPARRVRLMPSDPSDSSDSSSDSSPDKRARLMPPDSSSDMSPAKQVRLTPSDSSDSSSDSSKSGFRLRLPQTTSSDSSDSSVEVLEQKTAPFASSTSVPLPPPPPPPPPDDPPPPPPEQRPTEVGARSQQPSLPPSAVPPRIQSLQASAPGTGTPKLSRIMSEGDNQPLLAPAAATAAPADPLGGHSRTRARSGNGITTKIKNRGWTIIRIKRSTTAGNATLPGDGAGPGDRVEAGDAPGEMDGVDAGPWRWSEEGPEARGEVEQS